MNNQVDVIAGVGLDQRTRKSHWPARLDFVQSASGLFLGLFMWGHMAFVSTILFSNDAMWWVQAWTGFALFFLASVHLYQMLMHPGDIGPYESAERVWSGRWWPLYLVLLFAVELHGGVGLYRLAVKWGWFEGDDPKRTRTMLKRLKWAITIFFLT